MEANTQLINYNLMASFRTGNVILDMAIAMLVPQLMSWLVNLFNFLLPLLERGIDRLMQRRFRRVIVHSFEARPYLDIQTSNRNGILQNAIRQYIGRELKTPYHEGVVKLSKIQSASTSSKSGGTIVEQLEKVFRMIHLPQREVLEEVEPGLFFMESLAKIGENPEDDSGGRGKKKVATKTVVSLVLECDKSLGESFITSFVDRAYRWYLEQVEKDEDKSRFMYQPLVRDRFATLEDRKKQRIYKRYELSSDKTFRSLFFPEKERLLRILDNFSSKKGKYAIQGFPHKLGLLLHGPPGTGKTSLVKAIATYTGRNIISVPLSRIHTNQELMDVMFDQQFNFQAPKKNADDGDDEKGTDNKLTFDKVIFLLEDVDAASKVVHARSKQSTLSRRVTQAVERQYTHDGAAEGADGSAVAENGTPSTASAAEKLVEQQKMLLQLFKSQNAAKSDGTKASSGEASKEGDGIEAKKEGFWLSDKDKLSLSGLLTVLDGVIDAPGRILIMTTNHPEKLDPALTRPGRVNLQIYMGFIRADQAREMVRHYYREDATPAALDQVAATFETLQQELSMTTVGGFKLTPAEMEQLCAECVTIDELTQRLLLKGRNAVLQQNKVERKRGPSKIVTLFKIFQESLARLKEKKK